MTHAPRVNNGLQPPHLLVPSTRKKSNVLMTPGCQRQYVCTYIRAEGTVSELTNPALLCMYLGHTWKMPQKRGNGCPHLRFLIRIFRQNCLFRYVEYSQFRVSVEVTFSPPDIASCRGPPGCQILVTVISDIVDRLTHLPRSSLLPFQPFPVKSSPPAKVERA